MSGVETEGWRAERTYDEDVYLIVGPIGWSYEVGALNEGVEVKGLSDALVMASSRELLRACEAMKRASDLWLPGFAAAAHVHEAEALHELYALILAAIAKATGETQ